MSEPTRRGGRPRKRETRAVPAAYIGSRASHELKARLESAAKASGRSLSTEMQFRLEQSFEDSFDMWLGEPLAGLIRVIAKAMWEAGSRAGVDKAGAAGMTDWILDPWCYTEAAQAAIAILLSYRPEGEAVPADARDKDGNPLWTQPGDWGRSVAAVLVEAIAGQPAPGLRRWAEARRAQLGALVKPKAPAGGEDEGTA